MLVIQNSPESALNPAPDRPVRDRFAAPAGSDGGEARTRGTCVPLAAALLAVGFLVRVVLLDSDPDYEMWAGYVIDEGLWTELARELVLFGQLDLDAYRLMHTVLAPLYQAATALSFLTFGVGFVGARMVSAVCGFVLLAGSLYLFRTKLSNGGLLFLALGLAIHPDLVAFSRFAVPEMSALLFECLAFALIVARGRSVSLALAAGLTTAVALGMKATSMPIVPILAVILVVTDRESDPVVRLRRAGAFFAGVAIPAVVVLGAGRFVVGDGGDLVAVIGIIADFLRLDTLYGALTGLFYKSYAPSLNILLLPIWTLAGLLMVVRTHLRDADWSLYIGSLIWVVGWLLLATVLAYFPERYVLHALVPVLLNVATGVTLLGRLDGRTTLASVATRDRGRGALVAGWTSLPMAVVSAPVLLGVLTLFTPVPADRFSVQVAAIVLITVAFASLLMKGGHLGRRPWLTIVAAPLMYAPSLMILHNAGLTGGLWAVTPTDTAAKGLLLALAILFAGRLYPATTSGTELVRGAWGYAVPVLLLWVTQLGPRFAFPTYTIRDTSVRIGEMVPDSATVGSLNAGSLFLGNDLRYDEVSPQVFASVDGPDFAVIFRPLSPLDLSAYDTLLVSTLDLGEPFLPIDPRVRVFSRTRRAGPEPGPGN